MKPTPRIFILTGVLFISAHLLPAQATFDISDTFQGGSPGTAEALQGMATSTGGAGWTATSNVKLKKGDTAGYVATSDTRTYCANVPIPATPGTITVEGEVYPQPGGEKGNWAAIGLGANNLNFTWQQGLFLLADSMGSFEAAVNIPGKGIVRLKREKIPDLEEGKPVKLSIEYDPSSATVNMSVNGVPVVLGRSLENEQKPALDCAGFSGFGQKPGVPAVTQFHVSGAK